MRKIYSILLLAFVCSLHSQIINIPDVNFKAKLLSANTSTHIIAKNLQGTNVVIDINNDGEIQHNEAQNIGELFLVGSVSYNMNSITSLVGITNIKDLCYMQIYIYVSFNFMTSIIM